MANRVNGLRIMPFGNSIARLIVSGTRLARRTDLASTHGVVSQSRQRLECGDLSPLFSASASQLAADAPVPRAKAPTSWRTPNAAATAKPAPSLPTCRVRNALTVYGHPARRNLVWVSPSIPRSEL